MENYVGISENRLAHSLSVAKKMYGIALKLHPDDKLFAQDMFALGLLHDIGYEFSDCLQAHPYVGGQILQRASYRYWREIANHGNPDTIPTEAANILNAADLQIDSKGKDVGFEKRLADIKKHYGTKSSNYINAKNLAKRLQEFTC